MKYAQIKGKLKNGQKLIQTPYVIAITGTPCTGKSTLAAELAKQTGFKLVDGNQIIKRYGLTEGYDAKRKAKIVDDKRFSKAVVDFIMADFKKGNAKSNSSIGIYENKSKQLQNSKFKVSGHVKGYIVDSHMSHFLSSNFVNLCLVTKISIKKLFKRLTSRYAGKNKPDKASELKIRENLDSEILDICYTEALERGHNVHVLDTGLKRPKTLVSEVLNHIKPTD
ncbi:MAG: AAA family ATPase [Nanoarchaeota archaeon]|nr:AAA family ATPase [Nanoarchaeota archaeon]